MIWPGFIYGSYTSAAFTADCALTMNYYPEKLQDPQPTQQVTLLPTPGVSEVANAHTASAGRGIYAEPSTGRLFEVIGGTLYEMTSAGVLTSLGTVAADSDPATFCSNGPVGEMFITSGTNGYLFTLATNTLAPITNLIGKANMGEFMDGFFFALSSSEGRVYASALNDGTTWDPSVFQQRNLAADPWIAMKRVGRLMWLLGSLSSEVWYNAGSSPFPLAPYSSGLVQYGIAAPFSLARADDSLYWVARTPLGQGEILTTSGFQVQKVSSYALEFAFASFATLSDAIGDSYRENGHTFYYVTFPTAEQTWAMDTDLAGVWCQRGSWISEENVFKSRQLFHAFAFDTHYMLDGQTSAVYEFSSDIVTDVDGRVIRRMRRAPAMNLENQRVYYSYFQLDMDVGPGNTVDPGSDPQVMLRISNDGGHTFGAEQMRGAGKIGEFGRRVRWERCGMGRMRVYEISMTDPVLWRLTNGYVGLAQQPKAA